MKISEVLARVDENFPNEFSIAEKVSMLKQIDETVYEEDILTHEGYEGISVPSYTEDDLETVLLVGEPYAELYEFYIRMKIDMTNGDMERYDNDHTLFSSAHSRFKNYYNRKHMPLSVKFGV